MFNMFLKIIFIVAVIFGDLTVSQITEVDLGLGNRGGYGGVSVAGLLPEDQRAAVCYQGNLGNWTVVEAMVTCRHLGYLDGDIAVLVDGDFMTLPQYIVFDFVCNENGSSLAECNHGAVAISDAGCGIRQYAGVRCFSTKCGGTYNSTSGHVTSPNYPNRYPSGSECIYIINPPQASIIRIEFAVFDLEDGYDVLYFGRGSTDTDNEEYYLTGESLPDPIDFMVSSMWFNFISDESINDFGFSFTWKTSDTRSCDRYYVNETGTITSHGYPNPYPSFSNCKYILNIPNASHITIHFHDVDMEYRSDFLYYGIGTEPSVERSLEKITGNMNPGSVEIPGTSMWIIFITDAIGNYGGFNVSWDITTEAPDVTITDISISDELLESQSSGFVSIKGIALDHWVQICHDGASGYKWGEVEAMLLCTELGFDNGTATVLNGINQHGWILHNFECGQDATNLNECTWDGIVYSIDGCGTKRNAGVNCVNKPCGGVYTNANGSFTSPDFPVKYPPHSNCLFVIDVPDAQMLRISFNTFRLERRYDHLFYYSSDPDIDDSQYGVFTGFRRPSPLQIFTNKLWFRFESDQSTNHAGFELTWTSHYNECISTFTNKTGYFTSPNFPLNYPHLSHCIYYINVTNATQIEFIIGIGDFSIQRDSDWLYYGNGTHAQTSDFLHSLTGNSVRSRFLVHGGLAWFLFTSDLTLNGRGFNISWQARFDDSQHCGLTFTQRSGTIQSFNYPNPYHSHTDCTYTIHVPSANRLRITFQAFNLEDGYDFLYYGIGTNITRTKASLTGGVIPDQFDIMTGSMWFQFISDSGIENDGFSFTWEVIDLADCNGYYSKPSGSITSPNYPRSYPAVSNCTYILHVPGANHITINFQQFGSENLQDYLYYGVGIAPSVELAAGWFTGSMVPPRAITISAASMWFLFISDVSGSDVGFALTWDTIRDTTTESSKSSTSMKVATTSEATETSTFSPLTTTTLAGTGRGPSHRRATIAGYLIAVVLLIAVIIMGIYIFKNHRQQQYDLYQGRESIVRYAGDGQPGYQSNTDQTPGDKSVDHHNAAFEGDKVAIIDTAPVT